MCVKYKVAWKIVYINCIMIKFRFSYNVMYIFHNVLSLTEYNCHQLFYYEGEQRNIQICV